MQMEEIQNGFRMDIEQISNGYGTVTDHKKGKKPSLEHKLLESVGSEHMLVSYANSGCLLDLRTIPF